MFEILSWVHDKIRTGHPHWTKTPLYKKHIECIKKDSPIESMHVTLDTRGQPLQKFVRWESRDLQIYGSEISVLI